MVTWVSVQTPGRNLWQQTHLAKPSRAALLTISSKAVFWFRGIFELSCGSPLTILSKAIFCSPVTQKWSSRQCGRKSPASLRRPAIPWAMLPKSFRPQAASGTGVFPCKRILTSKCYACDSSTSPGRSAATVVLALMSTHFSFIWSNKTNKNSTVCLRKSVI